MVDPGTGLMRGEVEGLQMIFPWRASEKPS